MTHRIAAVVALATLIALPARAAEDRDGRKALQGQYARWATAFRGRDWNAIRRLAARDFNWRTVEGKLLDGDKAVELIQQNRRAMDPLAEACFEIQSVERQGSELRAVVTEKYSATPAGKDGKKRTLVWHRTGRHTWMKADGAWRLRRVEITRLNQTENGRPVRREGGGPHLERKR